MCLVYGINVNVIYAFFFSLQVSNLGRRFLLYVTCRPIVGFLWRSVAFVDSLYYTYLFRILDIVQFMRHIWDAATDDLLFLYLQMLGTAVKSVKFWTYVRLLTTISYAT